MHGICACCACADSGERIALFGLFDVLFGVHEYHHNAVPARTKEFGASAAATAAATASAAAAG